MINWERNAEQSEERSSLIGLLTMNNVKVPYLTFSVVFFYLSTQSGSIFRDCPQI